jgi:hypothetical protein
MEGIRRYGFGSYETFGWLAVVGKLEKMEHIRMFFFQDYSPGIVGHGGEFAADGVVPHFPVGAWEDGICIWDWAELEFGVWGEGLRSEDFVGFGFFLGVFLPFYVSNTR